MDIHQAEDLLQRFQTGDCTSSENDLIETWYQKLIQTGECAWSKDEKDLIQKMLEARIMKRINEKPAKLKPPVSQFHRYRWLAAASIILMVGVFSYVFFDKTTKTPQITKVLAEDIKVSESNRAMITLANGQKVFLDSVGNGVLAVQGNVKLVKLANGKIAYQQSQNEVNGPLEYNTLSNPRGSKIIKITLADGSNAWLNAGSAITYPVAFIGNERKVSINGEAYFEVEHDALKPFTVNKGSMEIQVLGTHFNVNGFEDDGPDLTVTLLEGSVKIYNGNVSGLLKPGQQAKVNKEVEILNDVDLDAVIAWKNGYFQFDHASLQNVLKQVSRCYDVNVVYKGNNRPREFVGEIQRDLSLSEVIKILEKNKVHFKIEGRDLIVLPD